MNTTRTIVFLRTNRTTGKNRKARISSRRNILASSAAALLALFAMPDASLAANNPFALAGFTQTQSVGGAVPATVWTFGGVNWTTGVTTTPSTSELVSSVFTFNGATGGGAAAITFNHAFTFESGFDGGRLEMSVNGGAFALVGSAAFTQNAYNNTAGGTNPLAGSPVFGGGAAVSQTSTANLGSFVVGDTVQLRWRGSWDGSVVTAAPNWTLSSAALITPDAANFWKGGASGTWTGANWTTDGAGTTLAGVGPGTITDVTFSATGAANQVTTLGANFDIHSLTINDAANVGINGNTLTVSGASGTTGITIGAGAGFVTINSNLILAAGSNTITTNNNLNAINGVISGSAGLIKAGTGLLGLSNAGNNYTGGTTINGGTLSITNGTALSTGSVTVANGGTLLGAATLTLANPSIALDAGSTTAAATGTVLTLNAASTSLGSGGGNVVFGNAGNTGVVAVSGNGGVVANASTLQVAFGTLRNAGGTFLGFATQQMASTTVDAGATLDVNDNSMTVKQLLGAGSVTLGANAATNLTLNSGNFSGVISGAGNLIKTTAGTLALTGANTYGGGTTLNAGTLNVGNNAALSGGTLTINGGTLGSTVTGITLANAVSVFADFTIAPTSQMTLSGAIDLQGGGRTITNGSNASFANFTGVISNGAAGLTLTETGPNVGSFTFGGAGANTYTGLTTVNANTNLVLQKTVANGAIAGNLTIDGTASVQLNAPFEQIADNAVVTVNSPGLTGFGVAGFDLKGFNETIGTLNGSATGVVGLGSGTLTVGSGNFAGTITDGFSGVGGNLRKISAGTLTLTGASTFTGGTFIEQGVLQVGVNNALPTGTVVTINSNTGVVGTNPGNGAATASLNLAGFNQAIAGLNITARSNAPNTVAVDLNGGTLTLNGSLNLVNATTSAGNGFGLTISDNGNAASRLDLGGAARSFTVAGQNFGQDELVVNAIIQNGGVIINATPSTFNGTAAGVIFNRTNTYSGVTTVNTGRLTLGAVNALGNGGSALSVAFGAGASNGVVEMSGFSQTVASISDNGTAGGIIQNTGAAATLTTGNAGGGTTTFAGTINGPLDLVKTGTDTQVLNGANTYTGGTTINGGVLSINTAGAIGSGNLAVNNTGSLLASASMTLAAPTITLGAGSNVSAAAATVLNLGAGVSILQMTGAGNISFGSAGNTGIVTIGNANAGSSVAATSNIVVAFGTLRNAGAGAGSDLGFYTSTNTSTTVNAGATLDVNDVSMTVNNLLGAGAVTLGANAATNLTLNAGNFSGTITGSGNLIKATGGTLALTADNGGNAYTGNTNINDGLVTLTGSSDTGLGTGLLTIGDGVGAQGSAIVRNLVNGMLVNTQTVVINSDGRYDLNGQTEIVGSIASASAASQIFLGNNGTLTAGDGTNTAFRGIISGTGASFLNKQGTGTLTLTGASTYSGGTNVTAGTLAIGDVNAGGGSGSTVAAVGAGPIVVSAPATLRVDLATGQSLPNQIVLNAGSVVNSTPATFQTLSGVIGGAGTFNQNGPGLTILTRPNSFTGPVNIVTGSLSVGNASVGGAGLLATAGAAANVVTASTGTTLFVDLQNAETFPNPVALNGTAALRAVSPFSQTASGAVSGTGTFNKSGTGTTIVTGTNTYTGGTFLTGGTLAAGNAKAFGNGNLTMIAGKVQIAGTPLSVNIGAGNIVFSGGTYQANVGGTSPGILHDQLVTTGTANLTGSTLALVQKNGYQLAPGDKVVLLSAAGGVAGGSVAGTALAASSVTGLAAFSSTPLLIPTVNVYTSSVVLEAMQGSFAALSGTLGFTPNQIATAGALDSLTKITGGKTGVFKELNFLDTQPLGTLAGNLDKIAPEELTSIFHISKSLANIQSANIQRRLESIRSQGQLPLKDYRAAANERVADADPRFRTDANGTRYLGGARGPSGHSSHEISRATDERLGMFMSGSGEFTNVGSTRNAAGFHFETGGITAGVDYRVNDFFAIGLSLGYVGTTASLANGGKLDVDGGRLGIYATFFDEGFHMDAAVTGGMNSYTSRRTTPNNTTATASPHGSEINLLLAAGYDWKFGVLTIGPTASYQYTGTVLQGFTETGTFAPLNVTSKSANSSRTALGFRASFDTRVGTAILRPEMHASWQHEFGDTSYAITSSFATLGGSNFTVAGPVTGRDSILMGAGFTILWNDRFSTYLMYDGEIGRANYDSHTVSGGVRLQF